MTNELYLIEVKTNGSWKRRVGDFKDQKRAEEYIKKLKSSPPNCFMKFRIVRFIRSWYQYEF